MSQLQPFWSPAEEVHEVPLRAVLRRRMPSRRLADAQISVYAADDVPQGRVGRHQTPTRHARGWCGTTRVEREYEKWSKHNVVDSDIGRIRIISMQHLDDALRDHPFREENEKWAGWLKGKEGVIIRFERANAAAAAVGMALDPALEKETRRLEPAEVRDALGPDVADALGAGVPVYLISADAVADKPWFPAASMTRLGLLIVGKPVSYADPDFGEFSVFDYSDAKGALHGVSAAGFIRYSYERE